MSKDKINLRNNLLPADRVSLIHSRMYDTEAAMNREIAEHCRSGNCSKARSCINEKNKLLSYLKKKLKQESIKPQDEDTDVKEEKI